MAWAWLQPLSSQEEGNFAPPELGREGRQGVLGSLSEPGGGGEGWGCTSEALARSFHSPQAPGARHQRPSSCTARAPVHTRAPARAPSPTCTGTHPGVHRVQGAHRRLEGEEISALLVGHCPGVRPGSSAPCGWAFLSHGCAQGQSRQGTCTLATPRWAPDWDADLQVGHRALELPASAPGETPVPTRGLVALGSSGFSRSLLPGLCTPL